MKQLITAEITPSVRREIDNKVAAIRGDLPTTMRLNDEWTYRTREDTHTTIERKGVVMRIRHSNVIGEEVRCEWHLRYTVADGVYLEQNPLHDSIAYLPEYTPPTWERVVLDTRRLVPLATDEEIEALQQRIVALSDDAWASICPRYGWAEEVEK